MAVENNPVEKYKAALEGAIKEAIRIEVVGSENYSRLYELLKGKNLIH